jgi:hypothetical protein
MMFWHHFYCCCYYIANFFLPDSSKALGNGFHSQSSIASVNVNDDRTLFYQSLFSIHQQEHHTTIAAVIQIRGSSLSLWYNKYLLAIKGRE